MNKTELVETIAQRTDLSKKDVQAVLDTFEDIAGGIVAKGKESLTIPGLPQVRADRSRRPYRPQPADGGDHPGPGDQRGQGHCWGEAQGKAKNGV